MIAEDRCSVPVTLSLGVYANHPHELTQPSSLLQAADSALYAAKNQGRNRVQAGSLATPESNPIVPAVSARA